MTTTSTPNTTKEFDCGGIKTFDILLDYIIKDNENYKVLCSNSDGGIMERKILPLNKTKVFYDDEALCHYFFEFPNGTYELYLYKDITFVSQNEFETRANIICGTYMPGNI